MVRLILYKNFGKFDYHNIYELVSSTDTRSILLAPGLLYIHQSYQVDAILLRAIMKANQRS